MTSRRLEATLRVPAGDVVALIDDQDSFPRHSRDVLSVSDLGDGLRHWELAFRGRTVSWTQRRFRHVEGDRTRIEFEQVDGDFVHLRGAWTVTATSEGAEVIFEVDFGTNVPNLAGAVDSAVGRVLVRSATEVLAAAGAIDITRGARTLHDLFGPEAPERRNHGAL